MPSYVQLTEYGVVHSVVETSTPIKTTKSIMEIPAYDPKYVGCLFDGNIFRKLVISCDKAKLQVGEIAEVAIYWVDADGNPINYGENVDLICSGIVEHVVITAGRGVTSFESEEPGEFLLVAVSPHGVRAYTKVVVL